MNQETVPCPEAHYGGARQCAHCDDDIPVGAPALQNEFRAYVHPGCVGVVTGRFGLKRPVSPNANRRTTTPQVGDVVDRTAAAMDRLFGPVDAATSTGAADAALDPSDPVDATAAAMDRLFGQVGG